MKLYRVINFTYLFLFIYAILQYSDSIASSTDVSTPQQSDNSMSQDTMTSNDSLGAAVDSVSSTSDVNGGQTSVGGSTDVNPTAKNN